MEDISKTLLDIISFHSALENKVLPLQLEQNNLQVAITNTNNFQLVKDLMLISIILILVVITDYRTETRVVPIIPMTPAGICLPIPIIR